LGAAYAAAQDPLPSWNDGPAKKSIVAFVEKVTKEGSSDFVPPNERIATFDNDGTLWCEKPMPIQLFFALDRLKTLAPQHPEWKTKEPSASLRKGDVKDAMAGGEHALLEIVMATHTGMTVGEFEKMVQDWIATAKHPTNMQRLIWSGIAMHAGNLPGYPASAGCVRLPVDFAAKLYAVTTMGSAVIIADNNSAPSTTTNPSLLFSASTSGSGGAAWAPEKAPKGPVSIIVSAPDGAAYVYRNGIEIGRSPVGGIGRLSGSHVYSALSSVDASGRRDWISTASRIFKSSRNVSRSHPIFSRTCARSLLPAPRSCSPMQR